MFPRLKTLISEAWVSSKCTESTETSTLFAEILWLQITQSQCKSTLYLKKAFSQHLFQLWVKNKILCASGHRDEQLREVQLPFLTEQAHSHLRVRVMRYPYVLVGKRAVWENRKREYSSIYLNDKDNWTDLSSADLPSSLKFELAISISGFCDTMFRYFPFVPSLASWQQSITIVVLLLAPTTTTKIKKKDIVILWNRYW